MVNSLGQFQQFLKPIQAVQGPAAPGSEDASQGQAQAQAQGKAAGPQGAGAPGKPPGPPPKSPYETELLALGLSPQGSAEADLAAIQAALALLETQEPGAGQRLNIVV